MVSKLSSVTSAGCTSTPPLLSMNEISPTIDTDRILMVVLIILGAFVAVAGMRVTASKTRMSYGEMGQEGSQRFLGIALVAIGFSIPVVFALMRGGIGYFVTV